MKNIRIITAPGETKNSHLRIRMGPKGTGAYDIDINIPFTLMFTDMFKRKVLTPDTERLFFTKGDDRARIACNFVSAMERYTSPEYSADKVPVSLILASVVYAELDALPDTYIESVFIEMEDKIPEYREDIFFTGMVEKCAPKVGVMKNILENIPGKSQAELYRLVFDPYKVLAENAANQKPNLKYHPEVLNGE